MDTPLENIRFKERQLFPLVIVFTAALLTLFVVSNAVEGEFLRVFTKIPFYIVLLLFFSPFLFWGIMKTVVTAQDISIQFGVFPIKKLGLNIKDVRAVEETVVKWPRHFRFLGITRSKDRKATGYFVTYGKGVNLTTAQGKIFIGSRKATQLLNVIRSHYQKKS